MTSVSCVWGRVTGRGRWVGAVGLLVLMSWLVAPAAAFTTGGFSDPIPVGGASQHVGGLLGAVRAPDGGATVAYHSGGSMYAVVVGTGSPPQRIGAYSFGSGGGGEPVPPGVVVAGPEGSRLIAWDDGGRAIRVAFAPPGAAFGAGQTIAADKSGSFSDVAGAVAEDGSAVVVWRDGSQLAASIRPAGSSFGTPFALASGVSSGAQLVATPNGSVVAAWVADQVEVSVLAPGAAEFAAPQVAPVETNGEWVGLGVLPDGTVLITTGGATVARLSASGAFEASEQVPVTADFTGDIGGGAAAGNFAVAADGSAALTVSGDGGVWVSTAPPGGTFGRPLIVGESFDPADDDVFAWPATAPLVVFQGGYDAEGVGVFTVLFAPTAAEFNGPEPSDAQQARATVDVLEGVTAVSIAGAQPHSATFFSVTGGGVYELDWPGVPDHRRPAVSLDPTDACDAGIAPTIGCETTIWITADKDVRLSAHVTVRMAGRWRLVPARFVDGDYLPDSQVSYATTDIQEPPFSGSQLEIPVPGLTRDCTSRLQRPVRAIIDARDAAGDLTRKSIAFTARCNL